MGARARSVDILQRRMKVTRQGTTFLVDINVSSESPRKAAVIANAVAESYFEEQGPRQERGNADRFHLAQWPDRCV